MTSQSSVSARTASAIRSTPPPSSGSRAARPPTTSGARNRRISSISPASRNAPARCGPPSSRIDVTSRAPSWSSAERTRAGSFSPAATTISAPAASSASVCWRGAARETTTVSGISGAARTSWLAMDAVHARGELGVVGQRGPDAYGDGVDGGAPVVGALAAGDARDPLRVPRPRGDLAVEGHRRLEQHPRPPAARVLAEGLVAQPRPRRELARGHGDVDALVAQDAQPASGSLLGRIVGAHDDARDARRDDRVGARRRLALVTARLQRDVE